MEITVSIQLLNLLLLLHGLDREETAILGQHLSGFILVPSYGTILVGELGPLLLIFYSKFLRRLV